MDPTNLGNGASHTEKSHQWIRSISFVCVPIASSTSHWTLVLAARLRFCSAEQFMGLKSLRIQLMLVHTSALSRQH